MPDISDVTHILRANRAFSDKIISSSFNIIYIYDLEQQVNTFVSCLVTELLGYSSREVEELGAFLFSNHIHPDDLPLIAKKNCRLAAAEDGEIIESRYRVQQANGEWGWLWTRESVHSRTGEGRPREILGVAQDVTSWKQVEHALRESEERFRRLAENAPDVIYHYRLSPSPGFDYINPAVETVTGYSREECYTQPDLVLNIIHPEDRALLQARWRELGSSSLTAFVVRLIHRSGALIWTDHRVTSIYDASGQLLAIEGVARDITASRQAETREKLAYELGQQLTRLLDPQHLLAVTVDRLSQTFGYYHAHVYLYQEEIPGAPSDREPKSALIVQAGTGAAGAELKRQRHAIPLDARRSLVARAARLLQPVIVNEVRLHPDHLPNPLLPDTQSEAAIPLFSGRQLIGVLDVQHTTPHHFTSDEIRTLEIIASELSVALANAQLFTALTQAEQALRKSEAKYREMANSISDIFFALDTDLRYSYWNKASEELTGIPAGEALGRFLWEIFPTTRGTAIEQVYKLAIRTGKPQNFVNRMEFSGSDHYFEINAYPTEHGLSVFAKDITERVKAEQALQQRNRALGLLSRAGQVFISTLDLDQVLSAILEEVRSLLYVTACFAWLLDPETGEMVCYKMTDPHNERARHWRLQPGQGLAGWVARTGQSLIVADAQDDPRHFKGIDEQTGLVMRSILIVPLKARQQVIGVLEVVDKAIDRFSFADQALLESLAATAAIAIENARLYERAREDAETKSTLLAEVNHRVKNNLAAIIGLLYSEQRHAGVEDQAVYQTILGELINRVQGLATVHSMLSASGWTPLRLSELVYQVIRSTLQALPRDRNVSIRVAPSPVLVTPDQAHHLALVINELATNTVQHALTEDRSELQIMVRVRQEGDIIHCEFRDDGPGYPEQMLKQGFPEQNVGFDLIRSTVERSLQGELVLYNDNGAVTEIRFRMQHKGTEYRE